MHPRRVDGDVRARGEPQARPGTDQGARAVGRSRGGREAAAGDLLAELQLQHEVRAHLVPARQAGAARRLDRESDGHRGRSDRRLRERPSRDPDLVGTRPGGPAGARRQLPPAAQDRRGDEDTARVRGRPQQAPALQRHRLAEETYAERRWHRRPCGDHVALARAALRRQAKARHGTTQTITRVYRHNRSYSFQWPRATCGANGCRVEHRPAPGAWTLQLLAEDVAGNFTIKPLGTVQVARR